MPEGFPCQNFLAEPLYNAPSARKHVGGRHSEQLTPMIFCKSLFEYVLMTLTATSRPQCFPFHTSANPPLYSATPVRS